MPLVKVLRHGQVTLPKEFRKVLGIHEGDFMEAELEGTRILFKPKAVVDKDYAAERETWAKLAAQNLNRAYEEPEPDYPPHLVKEPNPDFQP